MGRKKLAINKLKQAVNVYIEAEKIAKVGTIEDAKEFVKAKFDEL